MKWLLGVMVSFSACTDAGSPRGPYTTHELSFTKMTMLEYENGKLVYRATAEAAAGDRVALQLTGVKASHRGVDQTGPIQLTSTHATVDIKTNTVSFERGVKITDSFGRQVVTDSAKFDGETKSIEVPQKMTLKGNDVSFESSGLGGSNTDEVLELKGPVEGWFRITPQSPTQKKR